MYLVSWGSKYFEIFHTKSRRWYRIMPAVVPWDFWHDFYWPTPEQLLIILITDIRSCFWGLRRHLYTLLQCLLWSTAIAAKGSLLHSELVLLLYDGMFVFLICVSLLIKKLYSLILTWTASRKLVRLTENNFQLRTWQALGITTEKSKKLHLIVVQNYFSKGCNSLWHAWKNN